MLPCVSYSLRSWSPTHSLLERPRELIVKDLWVKLEPFHKSHTHWDSEDATPWLMSRTYSLLVE